MSSSLFSSSASLFHYFSACNNEKLGYNVPAWARSRVYKRRARLIPLGLGLTVEDSRSAKFLVQCMSVLYFFRSLTHSLIQDDDTTCSLALSSQGSNTDLDPLTDSLVEFGYDFSDAGGHRSNMTGQSRHLQRQAQPSPLAATSARAPTQSSRGKIK
jgi:hypothetical protein